MSMMIDGTVVVIITVEAGEVELVETNGEVVVKVEQEAIGEVGVKVEEGEDTGEVEDGEETLVEAGEEEEDITQEPVPLPTPWMMMMTWGSLTRAWVVKGIRDSELFLATVTSTLLVTALLPV